MTEKKKKCLIRRCIIQWATNSFAMNAVRLKNLCREYNNLPFEDEETQKFL